LASVALPADYAVSLNIQCMGADVSADFIVGECLGWDRVSSTSVSTFLIADLHLAWGQPKIPQDRFTRPMRLGYCDA
jgi:hypothetical protein